MNDVFAPLTLADYTFLVGLLESDVNLTDSQRLHALLSAYEATETQEARDALDRQLAHELRYLGSADIAYMFRFLSGQPPGVPLREVIGDVARQLKVEMSPLGTEREMMERLVEQYATQEFGRYSPKEQQQILESLGVEQERAAAFIKKSAGVFAVPALIKAFGIVVVDGLIKTVIFGAIGRIIGRQLAGRLFQMLASRFPWWIRWIGPVSWSLSLGWAVVDIQGPAYRKTIPAVLYLGLCSLRARSQAD